MSGNIKLEIEQNSIQEIVQAHVQTAVMEALMPHKERLVQVLVEKSLLCKTKHKDHQYTREAEKPTELEHMVKTMIAEEARKGILEWAESHREEIAEKIRKTMATKKFGGAVAAQIAEQLATANEYRFSVNVHPIGRD